MNFSCLFKPHYVCFFSFFKGQGAEIEQGTKMFRGKSSRTFDMNSPEACSCLNWPMPKSEHSLINIH